MRSWSKHKLPGTRQDSKTPTPLASSPALIMLGFVPQPNLHWSYFLGLTEQYWMFTVASKEKLSNILAPKTKQSVESLQFKIWVLAITTCG